MIPVPPKASTASLSLDLFCNQLLGDADVQAARMANCIAALNLVIRVLQQSDRGRDGAVARIILSIAQGQISAEGGRRELTKALLHG